MALDIYQAVTDRIIELLDRGTVPWRQPLRGGDGGGRLPFSLASGRAYRGINVFLLAVTAWLEGYGSPHWLTFRQARERGGHVRKGEKASLVVFWKQYATTDRESGEPITVPVLRHYRVFNAEQCEGVERPEPDDQEDPLDVEPIEEASRIVSHYEGGPRVEHKGSRAFYRPSDDLVRLPLRERFVDAESYYLTRFHELVHSTGHPTRLNRLGGDSPAPFGTCDYSKEELVAEMGAAFLAAAAGIGPQTIEQSASYIDGWRRRLSSDKKLVVQAAGAAQRAADWVLGERPGVGPE